VDNLTEMNTRRLQFFVYRVERFSTRQDLGTIWTPGDIQARVGKQLIQGIIIPIFPIGAQVGRLRRLAVLIHDLPLSFIKLPQAKTDCKR
jgi:hypothetical protein